jgi:hypothetical protein
MASLAGRQVSSTYKDILHVYNGTENQGLEVTTKRVFDGEGVGSPLYLGTDFIEVGTSDNADNSNFKVWGDGSGASQPYFLFNTSNGNVFLENGDLSVDGKVTADKFSLTDTNDNETDILTIDTSGVLQVSTPINTSNSITSSSTLTLTGTDDLKLSGSNSRISKGTDKGNIELRDNGVSLQKDGANLLEVKDDGEILVKQLGGIEDAFPLSPSDGSMVMKYDATGDNQGLYVYNS